MPAGLPRRRRSCGRPLGAPQRRRSAPARRRPGRLVAAAALGALLLAGCDQPPAATSVLPTGGPPTMLPRSARTAVLRPDQLAGYRRLENAVVSADSLARQNGDPPSPSAAERYPGLTDGARETFDSATAPLPSVVSEALVFDTPENAQRFLAGERARRAQAPEGGTVAAVSVPLAAGVDEQLVLQATVPPPLPGKPGQVAWFALLRRGAVVGELQAGGDPAEATLERFTALVAVQAAQLAG